MNSGSGSSRIRGAHPHPPRPRRWSVEADRDAPEADVYAHPKAVEHLVDPSRLAASAKQFFGPAFEKYGEVKGVNPMKIQESKDGEELDLQGATLKVIWTPGHASHGRATGNPTTG